MKHFITLIFCFAFTICFAQNKGINLIKNTSNKTKFIKENHRIKVKTTDGKSIAGKFSIINDSAINIKGRTIAMDSIVSIRKASTFSTILRTTSISIGTGLVVGGFAVAVSQPTKNEGYGGGFGRAAAGVTAIIGLPLVLIPLSVEKHPLKKWTYQIVNQ